MRILAIDDDNRITSFIERALRAEGYRTEVAVDATQGIEMAANEQYDLLLLDVMLPGMTGIEVCRNLREHGVQTPILMLTGKDSVSDRVNGLEAGADDYLTKPFAFEELMARIKAVLRRGRSVELATVQQVGDLVLDHEAHEVSRDGRILELTPTEFSLLEYLMRSSNRVLSRAMIEQHVWGYQQDPLTNVVDVYIGRLRRKVDNDFDPKLLHTIRGVGYQLKNS